DGLAIKYAFYPASGSAAGKVQAGQRNLITIRVPRALVGKPPVGARLSTVTAYAITHSSRTPSTPPKASNFTDIPQVADVLPAFQAKLTRVHHRRRHRSVVAPVVRIP